MEGGEDWTPVSVLTKGQWLLVEVGSRALSLRDIYSPYQEILDKFYPNIIYKLYSTSYIVQVIFFKLYFESYILQVIFNKIYSTRYILQVIIKLFQSYSILTRNHFVVSKNKQTNKHSCCKFYFKVTVTSFKFNVRGNPLTTDLTHTTN